MSCGFEGGEENGMWMVREGPKNAWQILQLHQKHPKQMQAPQNFVLVLQFEYCLNHLPDYKHCKCDKQHI
jgi:hypothetical protein